MLVITKCDINQTIKNSVFLIFEIKISSYTKVQSYVKTGNANELLCYGLLN